MCIPFGVEPRFSSEPMAVEIRHVEIEKKKEKLSVAVQLRSDYMWVPAYEIWNRNHRDAVRTSRKWSLEPEPF